MKLSVEDRMKQWHRSRRDEEWGWDVRLFARYKRMNEIMPRPFLQEQMKKLQDKWPGKVLG